MRHRNQFQAEQSILQEMLVGGIWQKGMLLVCFGFLFLLSIHVLTLIFFTVWKDTETDYLFEQTSRYISNVGSAQRFRNKKAMWQCIAKQINVKFNVHRTHEQVSNM